MIFTIAYLVIKFTFVSLVIFANVIFLHELGHFAYFKFVLGKNVEIRFMREKGGYAFVVGHPADWKLLNSNEEYELNMMGIIMGLLPLVLIALFSNMLYGVLVFPYLIGCWNDIKNSYEAFRR